MTLDEDLLNRIIQALEDQTHEYFLTANGSLVAGSKVDGGGCYPLPAWTGEDGYRLRCEFLQSLYPSATKRALQRALHSGRGSFKSFKETLRLYPYIQKLWSRHKLRFFRNKIQNWYASLCDDFDLKMLADLPEQDWRCNTSELLNEDFSFCTTGEVDKVLHILRGLTISDCFCDGDGASDSVLQAVLDLQRNFCMSSIPSECILCNAQDGEVAGFVLFMQGEPIIIAAFFVLPQYRGLGIGTKLLEMCKEGGRSVIMPIAVAEVERLATECGFLKLGTVLVCSPDNKTWRQYEEES